MILETVILTTCLALNGVAVDGDGRDSIGRPSVDTLTVAQAEQWLAERNADLRLARLDSAAAEVGARQARRLDNPEVEGLYNVYNPTNGRWFDTGTEGEVDISVSQPLPIGRRRRMARADAEVDVARANYDWVAFAAKMQLWRQMGEVWAAQRMVLLTERELASVDRIVEAYRRNPQAVSQVELRRVETLRLHLVAEHSARVQSLAEGRAQVALMLGTGEAGFAVGQLSLHEAEPTADSTAEQSALVRYHAALCDAAEAELRLQRAMAWPAVSIGVEYDKNGNIGHNFWAVGASVALPLFDRNKGGIRLAEVERDRRQAVRVQVERQLAHERQLVRARIGQCQRLETEASSLSGWDIEGVERQYLARNISLLELIDIYGAWREAQEVLVSSRIALLVAAVDYNMAAGQECFMVVDE